MPRLYREGRKTWDKIQTERKLAEEFSPPERKQKPEGVIEKEYGRTVEVINGVRIERNAAGEIVRVNGKPVEKK